MFSRGAIADQLAPTLILRKSLAATLAAALALGAPVEALARTLPTQRFPPVSFLVDETEKLQACPAGGVNS